MGTDEFLLCSLFYWYQTSNLKVQSFGAKNSSAVQVVIWFWGKKPSISISSFKGRLKLQFLK